MTRTEAISIIQQKLPSTDDVTVLAVAELLISAAPAESELFREFTVQEHDLVQQSKDDFAAGRTLSNDEYHDGMQAFIEGLRAKYPQRA